MVQSDTLKAFKQGMNGGVSPPVIKAKLLKGTIPLVSVIPKSSMTVLHDHHETNVSDGRMSLVNEHDPHRFPISTTNGMLGKQATAREQKQFKVIKPS